MLFLLFAAIICIKAAILPATPSPQACTSQGQKITLTPSGYSLPLTSYGEAQICCYNFTVPKGYFAYVDLKAYELQWKEIVLIQDSNGVNVGNDYKVYGNQNYSNAQSWPVDFLVVMATEVQTTAQMSLDIKVLPHPQIVNRKEPKFKENACSVDDLLVLDKVKFYSKQPQAGIFSAHVYVKKSILNEDVLVEDVGRWRYLMAEEETPNANIVKSYVTFPGSSAVFLYSTTWNDGESYKFTSKSGKVYVLGATDPTLSISMDDNWNNVFVYEGGVFKGTLAEAVRQLPYISTSNEVTLYCTKKVNVTGAVMVTDYSNVQGLTYNLEYVPKGISLYKIELDCSKTPEAAYTVVSDRTNPRNLTVDQIEEFGRHGVLSYIAGGPIQSHSKSIRFNVTDPPTVIRGYANTFYLNNGTDAVWFTL